MVEALIPATTIDAADVQKPYTYTEVWTEYAPKHTQREKTESAFWRYGALLMCM